MHYFQRKSQLHQQIQSKIWYLGNDFHNILYFREHTEETETTKIIRQQTGRGSIRRPAPTKSSLLRRKVLHDLICTTMYSPRIISNYNFPDSLLCT